MRQFQRFVGFLSNQLCKTIRDPSRLVFIPLSTKKDWLCRYPWFLSLLIFALPHRWMKRGAGKEFCKAVGYDLLQRDYPELAWRCLEPSLSSAQVSTDEYIMGAICLYHGLGCFERAMSLLEKASSQAKTEQEHLGVNGNMPRVLDNVWARHIGHIATIDYVIKRGMLEGRELGDTAIYLPAGSKVANPFLFKLVTSNLKLFEEPSELPFDARAVQAIHYDYLAPPTETGETGYFWNVAGKVYDRWDDEGREALFHLPPDIGKRGRDVLENAGVPPNAWFVALHVREARINADVPGIHNILNSDISTYVTGISEITKRGGWVIRMGDPGMVRMPALPNVIDYCHSDFRSDWMDIFLLTTCRFMLASASGPALIPPIFGVPALLTNWWPPAQRPWHASDIFIPKLIMKADEDRHLTLSEMLQEPFAWCHSRRYLAKNKISVHDASAELIAGAVRQMLDRMSGEFAAVSKFQEELARADRIYRAHGIPGKAQFADSYVEQYRHLIK